MGREPGKDARNMSPLAATIFRRTTNLVKMKSFAQWQLRLSELGAPTGGDFEEKMAMLLRWANTLNRSNPAFAQALNLLEGEDSLIGRVIRRTKTREGQ